MNGTGAYTFPEFMDYYLPGGRPTYDEYFLDSGQIKKSNNPSACGFGLICDPAASTNTGFTSFLDFYKSQINAGNAVLLYIEPGAGTTAWWTNYHVVTGAGFDNNILYFSDPNDTARGTNWGAQYQPGDTLVPAAGASDADRIAFYSKVTINGDGMTFDDGSYPTSKITRLYVLAVPEPATLSLLLVGLAVLLQGRIRPGVCPFFQLWAKRD
jgi:hypothetical protein